MSNDKARRSNELAISFSHFSTVFIVATMKLSENIFQNQLIYISLNILHESDKTCKN